ncbi:MAG TPA: C13 family peptidase [Sphingomicrobium sp.]|nr:C13 family peptidase [Sphingomicrobium sp.]
MSRPLRMIAACFAALLGGGLALAQPVPPVDDDTRLASAIARLEPQRPGVVDAYVVVAALDADPVFGREAREAGRVLAARFDAAGRTLVLANDEGGDRADAGATPEGLAKALGAVAARLNRDEDVLVLYTTSHGSPDAGLNFRDPLRGEAIIPPAQLAAMLAGFNNRLVILQACFSGQFVDALAAPRTVVVTASSALKSSFGCSADNDWTFFGHALINQAMRHPDSFERQFRRAYVTILGWEQRLGIEASSPQIRIGGKTAGWLAALDAREPKVASAPVGRPPSELGQ